MINRIREVRRSRNMTLDEVGRRCSPPTTAQTIGRLETGMRTLSLDWLNRIADALGVDSKELVKGADKPDLPIVAQLDSRGAHALSRPENAELPLAGDTLVALRIAAGIGDYRSGDMVWLRQVQPDDYARALNRDVLVPRPAGRFLFGRLIAREDGRMQILPLDPGHRQQVVNDPPWLGIAEKLIRSL
ncbi:MAG: helix-turn-helix transcriptional regulator [Blastomonas sp.]